LTTPLRTGPPSGGERPGERPGQVEHPDASQRPRGIRCSHYRYVIDP